MKAKCIDNVIVEDQLTEGKVYEVLKVENLSLIDAAYVPESMAKGIVQWYTVENDRGETGHGGTYYSTRFEIAPDAGCTDIVDEMEREDFINCDLIED